MSPQGPTREFNFEEDKPKPSTWFRDLVLFVLVAVIGASGYYIVRNQDKVRMTLGLKPLNPANVPAPGSTTPITKREFAENVINRPILPPNVENPTPLPEPKTHHTAVAPPKDLAGAGLKQGMTVEEVRAILGPPESATEMGSMVQMEYPGGVKILLDKENKVVGWSQSK